MKKQLTCAEAGRLGGLATAKNGNYTKEKRIKALKKAWKTRRAKVKE